jgi:hypothetical protein
MKSQDMTTGFTIHSWKKKLAKGIDTRELQLLALNLFLEDIGYRLVYSDGVILHVKKYDDCYRINPQYMSLNQAVSLYNGYTKWKVKGKWYIIEGFIFDREAFDKAEENRIISKVYLQRTKGLIKVQSNWIRFL